MADAKPKTQKYTVAKGRSLGVAGQDHGPGAEVELEEGEAKSLIAAGFLDNPDADEPVLLTGPKIQRTEG